MKLSDIRLGSAISDMHYGTSGIKLQNEAGKNVKRDVVNYNRLKLDGSSQVLDLVFKHLGIQTTLINKLLYVVEETSSGFKCMWSYDDRQLGFLEIIL